jgi:CubicO group peptidase (beta-lactamase class C family)
MSDQLPEGVVYEETSGYGLGGSYNTQNGQYGWSGAASTFFTVDTENDMVVLAFTQFMPFDIGYALEFNKNVHRAIVE